MDKNRATSVIALIYEAASSLPTTWTGAGIWGPQQAAVSLLILLQPGTTQSYRTCLPQVQQLFGAQFWKWSGVPDPRGFTDARHRLGSQAMCDLARRCRDQVLQLTASGSQLGPLGRRLVAFDGTDLLLFESFGSRTRFGGLVNQSGNSVGQPHALMVSAWDVINRVPLGWRLMPYGSDEREGARKVLPLLGPGDVAIFDRGYPGREFMRDMTISKRDFVIRLIAGETSGWLVARDFLRSRMKEAIVNVDLGEDPARPGQHLVVPHRFIRKSFRRGRPFAHQKADTGVIATSLLDPAITADELLEVYSNRWTIETIHKELKILFAVENWHTNDANLIEQEIAAIMIWQTLAAAVQHQAQEAISRQRSNAWNRPDRALAIRTMVVKAVNELLTHAQQRGTIDKAHEILQRWVDLLAGWAQRRRPGRSRPRRRIRPWGRFTNAA